MQKASESQVGPETATKIHQEFLEKHPDLKVKSIYGPSPVEISYAMNSDKDKKLFAMTECFVCGEKEFASYHIVEDVRRDGDAYGYDYNLCKNCGFGWKRVWDDA